MSSYEKFLPIIFIILVSQQGFLIFNFIFYLVLLYLVEEADKEIDKIDPHLASQIHVFTWLCFFYNWIKKQVKAYARSLAFIIIMVFSNAKPNVYTVEMNLQRAKAAKSRYKIPLVKQILSWNSIVRSWIVSRSAMEPMNSSKNKLSSSK